MCLFRRPKATPMAVPDPIQPRIANQEAAKSDRLPEKKELLDPDEVADVSYGSQKKKTTAGRKTGTSALKIPLNTGTAGSSTGGLNV